MARIKLEPLIDYSFTIDIKVRTTDLNYRGHLGNDALFALVHEARVAFLFNYGFSEENFGGVSLIIADAGVVYLNEVFAGEVLRFEVAAGEPTRCGFRLLFRVTRPADKKTIALVENGMVCFDYDSRSTRNLPESVQPIFNNTP